MKTIQNAAAMIFIACVAVLSVVSVLGIWDFFAKDVIVKSWETMGLLALVAVVVVIAGRYMGNAQGMTSAMPTPPNPVFATIRNLTLVVLVASSGLLALVGVLAIWEVISNHQVISKTLSSLSVLAFSSFIIVTICLEREQTDLWKRRGGQLSGGAIIAAFILVWILLASFGGWR
jgi:hypothetical protein